MLDGLEQEYFQTYLDSNDGDMVSLRGEGAGLDKIRVAPGWVFISTTRAACSAMRCFANASYGKQAGDGLFLKAAAQLTLKQNVSGVTQPSNSLLPHVRTDVAGLQEKRQFEADPGGGEPVLSSRAAGVCARLGGTV